MVYTSNKYSCFKNILALALFMAGWKLTVNCQENYFRGHFIIAYDVSSPFVTVEKSNLLFNQALIDLFTNKNVTGYDESKQFAN